MTADMIYFSSCAKIQFESKPQLIGITELKEMSCAKIQFESKPQQRHIFYLYHQCCAKIQFESKPQLIFDFWYNYLLLCKDTI